MDNKYTTHDPLKKWKGLWWQMQTKAKTVVSRHMHPETQETRKTNHLQAHYLHPSHCLLNILTHLLVNEFVHRKVRIFGKTDIPKSKKKNNLHLDLLCIKQICQTLNSSNCQNMFYCTFKSCKYAYLDQCICTILQVFIRRISLYICAPPSL